jgi:hypothetical protein
MQMKPDTTQSPLYFTKTRQSLRLFNYTVDSFRNTLAEEFIKSLATNQIIKKMKKISYILFVTFFSFRLIAVGQMKIDSIQRVDSPLNALSPKALRKEKDSIAKSLTPMSDKAIVYITRNHVGEWLIPYRMDCDSFQIGWIKAGTYLYTILDPGDHVFICTPPTTNEVRLKLNLEPGKIYYVDITYGIGIINTVVKMKIKDSEKGKKDLIAADISKSNQYPLFPKSKEVEKSPPDDK